MTERVSFPPPIPEIQPLRTEGPLRGKLRSGDALGESPLDSA